MNIGRVAKSKDLLDFVEFHGDKKAVKNFMDLHNDDFKEVFTNVPFGPLKFKESGEKVPVCMMVRDSEGVYEFVPMEEFQRDYHLIRG